MRGSALLPALLLAACVLPGKAEAAATAFVPGERLEFVLEWAGIPAGDSVMEVDRQVLAGGEEAWRISSVTTSRSLVDVVYKVRNRYESWIGPSDGISRKYIIHQQEGGRKRDVALLFDPPSGSVTVISREKGRSTSEVFPVPPGAVDTLAALYLVRNRPLAVGEKILFPVFEGKKNWELTVEVLAREEIEVPAGTFMTFKLHPLIKYEGIFRRKGDLFVWVTDDDRRIPVLMRSKVPVGSINAVLQRCVLPSVSGSPPVVYPLPSPSPTPPPPPGPGLFPGGDPN